MAQSPNGLEKGDLWKALVDTAKALPMYKNHRRYVEDVMLKESPEISPQELAVQLNIPIGEALVLLDEVRRKSPKSLSSEASGYQRIDRSLLEFSR